MFCFGKIYSGKLIMFLFLFCIQYSDSLAILYTYILANTLFYLLFDTHDSPGSVFKWHSSFRLGFGNVEKFESNLPVCICTEIVSERDLVAVTHLCVSLTRTRTLLPAVETSSNTPTLKSFKFQSFRYTENM